MGIGHPPGSDATASDPFAPQPPLGLCILNHLVMTRTRDLRAARACEDSATFSRHLMTSKGLLIAIVNRYGHPLESPEGTAIGGHLAAVLRFDLS